MKKLITFLSFMIACVPVIHSQSQSDSIASVDLGEVTVMARRPEAIVTPEKISYSPSATLSGSSGTLYEAMLSLPGVNVDNGGAITVNGQKGITVTIDGRKSVLTGETLLIYLKSLPASSVDRIEILSAPTAKSDASSGVTILNLKMRRNRDTGYSLGVNGSGRLWRSKRGLGSVSFGYNTAKSSFSMVYTFIAARNPSKLFTDRRNGGDDNWLEQIYNRHRRDRIHNLSISSEHRFSNLWNAGLSATGNWFTRYELGEMVTTIFSADKNKYTKNNTDMRYRNLFGNAFLKHNFEDGNGDLSFGFDYFYYHSDESQLMVDNSDSRIDGDMGGDIEGYVGTIDLRRSIGERWKFLAGIKSTYLLIDNGGNYDGSFPDEMPADDNLSSAFGYRENVNAAYLECKMEFPPFSITAGIRGEQTNVKSRFSGNEAIEKSDYQRHYVDLFQNASIGLRLGGHGEALVSYARRINRPRYADLNPFVYIFDDITHVGGNINLKPSISNNLQLVYSYNSWLRIMVSGSIVNDEIVKCYREISDKVLYVSPENLRRKLQSSMTISAVNIPVRKWWNFSVNATVVYDNYKFGKRLDLSGNRRFTPLFDCKNLFTFYDGWSAEFSGQWRGKMAYGQAIVGESGSVYVGLKKSVLGGQGSVSLFVRDMFNTNHQCTIINLSATTGSLSEYEYENMRQIGVSFALRLKTGKVRATKKTESNLIDEIKRVNL